MHSLLIKAGIGYRSGSALLNVMFAMLKIRARDLVDIWQV